MRPPWRRRLLGRSRRLTDISNYWRPKMKLRVQSRSGATLAVVEVDAEVGGGHRHWCCTLPEGRVHACQRACMHARCVHAALSLCHGCTPPHHNRTQDTVATLKQQLHSVKRKLHPSRQRLTLPLAEGQARPTALEDGSKLGTYGLKEGSIVQLKDLGPQVAAGVLLPRAGASTAPAHRPCLWVGG